MFCNACGEILGDGADFCTRCGRPAGSATAPPATVKRPTGVTLLAIYDFAAAGLSLLLGIAMASWSGGRVGGVFGVLGGIVALFGVLRLAAGWGLLLGAPWARILHFVLSGFGVLNLPVGTVVGIASFVYLTRPAIALWFAKKDPATWSPEEGATWNRAAVGATSGGLIAAVVGGAALFLVFVVGIVAAIAIPNLLNAVDRGKQKRTMADLRTIGRAMEAYAEDAKAYPAVGSEFVPVGELREVLVPTYITALPTQDGWGHPMLVSSTETGYALVSPGKDGLEDVPGFAYGPDDGGTTDSFDADIVFASGRFFRYPEGAQR